MRRMKSIKFILNATKTKGHKNPTLYCSEIRELNVRARLSSFDILSGPGGGDLRFSVNKIAVVSTAVRRDNARERKKSGWRERSERRGKKKG